MGVMYQHFNLLQVHFFKRPRSEDRTNPVARFEVTARFAIHVARLDLRLDGVEAWNALEYPLVNIQKAIENGHL